MTIVFQNCIPKILKFGLLYFAQDFVFCQIRGADFKYDNSLDKSHLSSTHKRRFWSRIRSLFVLQETLQFDKFQVADFKYENSFSKLHFMKYPVKTFWLQIWLFLFCTNFFNLKNSRVLISIVIIVFFFKFQKLTADFKYDNGLFKFQWKNAQVIKCWFQTWSFLV